MLTATEEPREESGRSLSRFYLEAQPFLGESRERSEPVSAAEALAALRRAGGGPAGWRDHVETTNANAMLPSAGLRTSASRLAPYENCPLQFFFGSLVEIGGTRTTPMRLGGAFHDVLEAFHDPERKEPQTLERLLELAQRAVVRGGDAAPAGSRAAPPAREAARELLRLGGRARSRCRGARGRAALPLRARRDDAHGLHRPDRPPARRPPAPDRLQDLEERDEEGRGGEGPPARALRARLPRRSGADARSARSPSSSTCTRATSHAGASPGARRR